MHLSLALSVALLATATGCASYTSTYEPPADGRARVLWDDNEVVMGISETTEGCLAAVGAEAGAPTYRYRASGSRGVSIWVPVPIVVVHRHGHSHAASRPVSVGRHGAHPTMSRSGGGVSTGGGGGSGGGGDSAKAVYVALAVAVIIGSPFIAYGLSLGRAEPEEKVAAMIDRVNAYNDLARWPGTPCSGVPAQ